MTRLIALVFVGVAACGGGSGGDIGGVPGDTRIVDLTDPEISSVCDAEVTASGAERTVDCGGGTTITIGAESKQSCIDNVNATPVGCTATVNDVIDCFNDISTQTDAEICANTLPASCAVLFSAACSPG